jgi:hypothetical protein
MRETQVPMAGMSDAKTTPFVFYDLVICKLCHAQRIWRVMLEGGKADQMKKAAIDTRIVSGEANFWPIFPVDRSGRKNQFTLTLLARSLRDHDLSLIVKLDKPYAISQAIRSQNVNRKTQPKMVGAHQPQPHKPLFTSRPGMPILWNK